jgi:hypothetical protein
VGSCGGGRERYDQIPRPAERLVVFHGELSAAVRRKLQRGQECSVWFAETEHSNTGRGADVRDGAWRAEPGFSQTGATRATYPEHDRDALAEARSKGSAAGLLSCAEEGIAATLEER